MNEPTSTQQKTQLKTSYFTFGQTHVHSVNGITFDKDCVVKITAAEPREVMVNNFGLKWGFEYKEQPNMDFYPRGVFEL
jgi:hypothetical protein